LFRTLDRYVLREVALAWLAVTGVLLVILVSNQLARILGLAAANGFPQQVVLALIGLTSLQNLTVLVPVAILLAVMMALGRLYHDSEMAAIRACGTGPERLYLPVLSFAAVVAIALAWLAFELAPAAYAGGMQLRAEALREAQFGRLEAGKFRTFAGGTAVFYAERADADGTLHNVFLQRQVGERVEIATAARAVHRIEDGGRLHVVVSTRVSAMRACRVRRSSAGCVSPSTAYRCAFPTPRASGDASSRSPRRSCATRPTCRTCPNCSGASRSPSWC
jgi:lipopolysaccharide export system permease protein